MSIEQGYSLDASMKVEVDVTELQCQVLRKVNLCFVNFRDYKGGEIPGQQNNPISIVAVYLKGLRRQGIYKICLGVNKGTKKLRTKKCSKQRTTA